MTDLGLITGSGFYELDGAFHARVRRVSTPYGEVPVQDAAVEGHRVLAVARHGTAHERLSNQVQHRAILWALKEAGARAVVATSVVGVMDPQIPLARPILFDDLYFPSNRLPDGSLATFFHSPGAPGRAHLIFTTPFSPWLRERLLAAAQAVGTPVHAGGCYVHVDGPRLNTRAEIAALRAVGGTALSQTCGPEAVLSAELELPYALLGFGVNHAAGVVDPPTPPEELAANLQRHPRVITALLLAFLRQLPPAADIPFDTGILFRMKGRPG